MTIISFDIHTRIDDNMNMTNTQIVSRLREMIINNDIHDDSFINVRVCDNDAQINDYQTNVICVNAINDDNDIFTLYDANDESHVVVRDFIESLIDVQRDVFIMHNNATYNIIRIDHNDNDVFIVARRID